VMFSTSSSLQLSPVLCALSMMMRARLYAEVLGITVMNNESQRDAHFSKAVSW
jgi:hypothetical protein